VIRNKQKKNDLMLDKLYEPHPLLPETLGRTNVV